MKDFSVKGVRQMFWQPVFSSSGIKFNYSAKPRKSVYLSRNCIKISNIFNYIKIKYLIMNYKHIKFQIYSKYIKFVEKNSEKHEKISRKISNLLFPKFWGVRRWGLDQFWQFTLNWIIFKREWENVFNWYINTALKWSNQIYNLALKNDVF